MNEYQLHNFTGVEFSVAFTTAIEERLDKHFIKDEVQEDLTFAYWRPSRAASRYTGIIYDLLLPEQDERILQGNVAFTHDYLERVLDSCPAESGIALIHSHLGPGWQDMSGDDIVAERDRLAGVVTGRTGLPLLGLTWSTDATWSARFWLRADRREYRRQWVTTVRSVGPCLRISYAPHLSPPPSKTERLVATRSVWGETTQDQLARTRVGIVGLGSVGSLVAEALSRTGLQRLVFIDNDVIEERNLDRTLGALWSDVTARTPKVDVAKRVADQSHTAEEFSVLTIAESLITPHGLAAALDCDVLISCVDRPWPTYILNKLAYLHLIPVIDGGIIARLGSSGSLLHIDWTIQTVGPGRACLLCLDALRRSDVALDREGSLDDPDYIQGLSSGEQERFQRRNVFAFSMSVAAHEILQLVGLISGNNRIGGTGPQRYRAYPGRMDVKSVGQCHPDCDISPLTATAVPIIADLQVEYGYLARQPPPSEALRTHQTKRRSFLRHVLAVIRGSMNRHHG
ncbi:MULTISPECIES: ThiF family adenylyltransferase [Ferrimicrobium]|uniref:ThiF family adenylyltransferase n=1 Tax=Ferrimicrobium acidiphilum TaxID=121039 RepID=A0ABV3XYP1_9ACTN|nr:ThiF family adenylyltransferase [Ferrimicrobium sp.]